MKPLGVGAARGRERGVIVNIQAVWLVRVRAVARCDFLTALYLA